MKAAAIILVLAVVFGLGTALGAGATASHYRAKLASLQHDQAKAESARQTALIAAAQADADKQRKVLDEANETAKQARADADAAAAANRKLRQSLASYRARYATAVASAGQGEPGGDPIGVLTHVLSRMDEACQRISRHADEVKIAGLTCEKLSTNEEK